ncbi:hypothetical protein JCGZ_21959 [Jatropha curcas]|uniref:adenylate dimethylallyltransferase (ADP/ATP-dependent) n=2 Tax=Jatropha curcas TaxID=180498 RepID=A0A067JFC4_JATCU|nr:hypothetical protein JCGZ_21959 [Jatropha curcas]
MQVYKGLEVTTNKITEEESSGVPHHLLGVVNPNADFTAKDFCNMASLTIESISIRGLLPIIVGGSNSYIEALVDDPEFKFRSRYDCCFLWVDVSMLVLKEFLYKRVDEMVNKGMVDEVRNIFDPNADYSRGIRKSIGVPELDKHFRSELFLDEEESARVLQEAIREIKSNNYKLALRQVEKIRRLKNVKGWNIHRIDATEFFRNKDDDEMWKTLVGRPSIAIVRRFLYSLTATGSSSVSAGTAKDYIAQCLVS